MASMQYKADESSGMVLLTGNSHPELARLVSDRLGIRLGDATVYNKTNRGKTWNFEEFSKKRKHENSENLNNFGEVE